MSHIILRGDATEIGAGYGAAVADQIRQNLSILVWREGYEPLPHKDEAFVAWTKEQESIIDGNWPWLLEEMAGVASAAGVEYQDILLLNLRAWQYQYYGARPVMSACSSLAITLNDGTVACAGALDDPIDYYCGPVKFSPTSGYGFITFPLTGTSWGNRGMNSKGLSVGVSSQVLPGLRPIQGAVNQDLAVRVILQTCATVDEVRDFCKAHPFTLNFVCVDAEGGIFCAQHTAAGLREIATDGYSALTNHVADDQTREWLERQGVTEFPEGGNTRQRLEKLQAFAREKNGRCTADEVLRFIGTRDDDDPGTIHNSGSIYLTYANPQADARTFLIMQPKSQAECHSEPGEESGQILRSAQDDAHVTTWVVDSNDFEAFTA